MSTPVSTTTPGMHAAAGYLGTTQDTARKGVQSVVDALGLLKSTWTGDASTAFDTSMNSWMSDCNYIVTKLGEMIDVMNGNRQIITAGEDANVDVASSIPTGAGLPGL